MCIILNSEGDFILFKYVEENLNYDVFCNKIIAVIVQIHVCKNKSLVKSYYFNSYLKLEYDILYILIWYNII